MMKSGGSAGQVNVMAALLLLALVVAGVWTWKRIPPDTQDLIVQYTVPVLLALAGVGLLLKMAVGRVRQRRLDRDRRERLMVQFEREGKPDTRLELGFTLVETNHYRLEGLERIAPALAELFMTTLTTMLDDKQHRIRGMAASHLGVLQEPRAVPLLLNALEDDHAYVRSSAALGLGRMRAREAKDKLAYLMKEDWDQTVRSRAREALERLA
jgi:hypothetical protein